MVVMLFVVLLFVVLLLLLCCVVIGVASHVCLSVMFWLNHVMHDIACVKSRP